MLLGLLYWLLGLVAVHLWWDALYIVPSIFFLGFLGYTTRQESRSLKVTALSAVNAVVHSAAVISLTILFGWFNAVFPPLLEWWRLSFVLFAVEMITVGGVIAATLFGGYLFASSRWWNLNHNDAFSSMRLDSHRNFLRFRIKDDEATVYPVGLDRVPRRDEWRLNTQKAGSPSPQYVPVLPLAPRLIEGPIAVIVPTHQ